MYTKDRLIQTSDNDDNGFIITGKSWYSLCHCQYSQWTVEVNISCIQILHVWYDTIRCATLTCDQKMMKSQLNLPYGTKQKITKKLKTKKEMLRRNGSVMKSVESVLRLWWKRFVKEVGLEVGVKERGSYVWWEWWVDRVRKCGRSMIREVRDRGSGMRLTEGTRKLIPETWWGIPEGAISYT